MSALENLKSELAALRDEAKVQAHLGDDPEWEAAEAKWNHFVARSAPSRQRAEHQVTLEFLATNCVRPTSG